MFSRPEVIRRAAADFVPVALKAALVNGPPDGPEGRLLAELGRTKAAPQGICVVHPAGWVIAWALSFDADTQVEAFLAHALARFHAAAGTAPAPTERYLSFPSKRFPDVAAPEAATRLPAAHEPGSFCPGTPPKPPGTFEARLVGRAVGADGSLSPDTTRQDRYAEDRVDIPADVQAAVVRAATSAGDEAFPLPVALGRLLVSVAYLGQLDVRPLASPVPGHVCAEPELALQGRRIPGAAPGRIRLAVSGRSVASADEPPRAGDGAAYAHTVTLAWEGLLECEGERFVDCVLVASGRETLRWTNPQFEKMARAVPDVARLPAGRPLDADTAVRYGVTGSPVTPDRESASAPLDPFGGLGGPGPSASLPPKVRRLHEAVARWREAGRDPGPVVRPLAQMDALLRAGRFGEAERLVDEALRQLEGPEPGSAGAGVVPASLEAKVARLRALVEAWRKSGRDPEVATKPLAGVADLIAAGRWAEAAAIVDRVLEALADRSGR